MKRLACRAVAGGYSWSAVGRAAHPDLSGFWMPVSKIIDPDPQLAKFVPKDAVVMRDTGPAEFGLMDFGG